MAAFWLVLRLQDEIPARLPEHAMPPTGPVDDDVCFGCTAVRALSIHILGDWGGFCSD